MKEYVEVIEVPKDQANHYLQAGYQLLRLMETTEEAYSHPVDGQASTFWVRKRLIYILGRPSGIPVFVLESEEA